MTFRQGTEEYYQKFIELQDKLRKSEEERLNLEMKFNEMMQITREEEQSYYRKLRGQYKQFLEENRMRQERNEKILRLLERVESRAYVLEAKTQRFEFLRKQYQTYFNRMYAKRQMDEKSALKPESTKSDFLKPTEYGSRDPNNDILSKYLGNSSDHFNSGLNIPSYSCSSIADEILNSIYKKKNARARQRFEDDRGHWQNPANTAGFGSSFTNIPDGLNQSSFNRASKILLDHNQNSENFGRNLPFSHLVHTNQENNSSVYGNHRKDYGDIDIDVDEEEFNKELEELKSRAYFNQSENAYTNKLEKPKKVGFDRPNDQKNRNGQNYAEGSNGTKNTIVGDYQNSSKLQFEEDKHEILEKSRLPFQNEIYDADDDDESKLGEELLSLNNYPRNQIPFEDFTDVTGGRSENLLKPSVDLLQKGKMENSIREKDSTDQIRIGDAPNIQENNVSQLGIIQHVVEQPKDAVQILTQSIQNVKQSLPQNATENPISDDNVPRVVEKRDSIEKKLFKELQQGDMGNTALQKPIIQNTEDLESNKIQESNIVEENKKENINVEILPEINQNITSNENHEEYQQQQKNQQFNLPEGQIANVAEVVEEKATAKEDLNIYNQNATEQHYDDQGQPIYYDENGPPVDYNENNEHYEAQYDESGQVIQYDKNGQPLQYDKSGNEIKYDENGYQIQYDENGQAIHYDEYDENGQPVQYDENGQSIKYDENGQVIQYDENTQNIQYDQNGQPIQYNENDQPVNYNENGQAMQYDESGQPIRYDESGLAIHYDENGQAIQYDKNGQAIHYDKNGQAIHYDESGQVIQYDENGQAIHYDETGQAIHYDENGQAIQYDENGQVIQYDDNGQAIQYDENGQAIQYEENGQANQYDENGQAVQYDENGQAIQYDENGQAIHYDENGQAIHYDENGHPIQYDENGQAIQYDVHGQNVFYDQPIANNGQSNGDGELSQQIGQLKGETISNEVIKPTDGQISTNEEENLDTFSKTNTEIEGSESVQFQQSDGNKKNLNVLDLLETDSESIKQETNKISNDSDFDISNNA